MLTIKQHVIDALVAHAREESPNECCGLLGGTGGVVDASMRAHNLKASPTEYLVDPADHFAAIRQWRAEGLDVIGAYHSHPRSEAVPSATDVREAYYPEFAYVIVSLQDPQRPDIRAYQIARGNFTPVTVVAQP